MKELIFKQDAVHAVLHNEGQAAVAAVQRIAPAEAIPLSFVKEKIDRIIGASTDVAHLPKAEQTFVIAYECLLNEWSKGGSR